MILRYISLHMDFDSEVEELTRAKFNLSSRFISNFLSRGIRILKFETDDFNMISVTPSKNIKHLCRIVGEKSLQARVSFNPKINLSVNTLQKYEYYLELLEEGYLICNQFKKIPLEYLLQIHDEFRKLDYRNEWLFKKKKFKEQDMQVELRCFFTSSDFQLKMTVSSIKDADELVSGVVIRTLPNEVHFDSLFKDVVIDSENLVITEYADRPKFIFKLSDLYHKIFHFKITDLGLNYVQYDENRLI